MYLAKILEAKRGVIQSMSVSTGERAARMLRARPPRDFAAALRQPGMSLIAEVKSKSPSHGTFKHAAEPVSLAVHYQASGARAVSVLADSEFFGGGPQIVERIANDPGITASILYKDFVIDPQQVSEARACGADAVLLIARAVDAAMLKTLVGYSHELGMEALVEAFDEGDILMAVRAGARIIGINNRDLETFQVDLQRSIRLVHEVPPGIVKVSESGVRTREDVLQLEEAGFEAILVGESLLESPDPGRTARELLGSA